MSIAIISKKKLAFRNPDGGDKDKFFTIDPLVMTAAPDWVAKDPMYAWAKAAGTITAVEPDAAKGTAKKGTAEK